MTGMIHSIESFGTVDGPGIRLVVFLKGCPMRCQYCHNPDTWDMAGGAEMDTAEILAKYQDSKAFYKNGGITATGGEPLLQLDFVTELFEAARERQIHTCLDTSGVTFREDNPEFLRKMDRLTAATSLVMLDIKHIDPEKHRLLTGHSNEHILAFARYLNDRKVPIWIRHVVVPGITDKEEDLYRLGLFIGTLPMVKALDVLPYHDMGKVKYEQMGLDYPLKDVLPETKEGAIAAKKIILSGIKYARLGAGNPHCS